MGECGDFEDEFAWNEALRLSDALIVVKRGAQTLFVGPVVAEDTVQVMLAPRVAARGPVQIVIGSGQPVGAEWFRACRPVGLLVAFIGGEEFIDRGLVGVEIDAQGCGDPFDLPGPILKEVGIFHEHAGQPACVAFSEQAVFHEERSAEFGFDDRHRRGDGLDDFVGVADRDHGADVVTGDAGGFEPHAGYGGYLQVLDDVDVRRRQCGQVGVDFVDVSSVGGFFVEPQCGVGGGAVVAAQDFSLR